MNKRPNLMAPASTRRKALPWWHALGVLRPWSLWGWLMWAIALGLFYLVLMRVIDPWYLINPSLPPFTRP